MLKYGEMSNSVTYYRADKERRQKVIIFDSQDGIGEFWMRYGCRAVGSKNEWGEVWLKGRKKILVYQTKIRAKSKEQ